MKKIVDIKNLSKSYGKNRGIVDVNLEIFEKEIFGFIGPNGAGKSTMIRSILGLIIPNSGEVTIFDEDALKYPEKVLDRIGYLPSEVYYYDKMKAIDLLKYSASFYQGDHMPRILDLAMQLNLDLNKKIEDMSFGNKKKVGIIQGLLHRPKLIILDEPTGGLDPLIQQRFFDILEQENKNGATILFSSHILSEVQKMCNRVALIKEGKIIEIIDMEVLSKQNYKKVNYVSNSASIVDLEGIRNLTQVNDQIEFIYSGDIQLLLNFITKQNVSDLNISEPTLEEIFMHFYE